MIIAVIAIVAIRMLNLRAWKRSGGDVRRVTQREREAEAVDVHHSINNRIGYHP